MEQGPIFIRAVRAGDAGWLKDFYASLSPESRATRFMAATRGITEEQAKAFATAKCRGAQGFVAVDRSTEEVVGHLCLEPSRPGVEEIGVAIADRLQGRGIGRELVKAAAASARRRGAAAFEATMLAGNRPIHRLLQRAGIPWRRRHVADGLELITLDVLAAGA